MTLVPLLTPLPGLRQETPVNQSTKSWAWEENYNFQQAVFVFCLFVRFLFCFLENEALCELILSFFKSRPALSRQSKFLLVPPTKWTVWCVKTRNKWCRSWTVSAWGHSRGELRGPRPVSRYKSWLTSSLISWACVSRSQLCMCASASVSLFSPAGPVHKSWPVHPGAFVATLQISLSRTLTLTLCPGLDDNGRRSSFQETKAVNQLQRLLWGMTTLPLWWKKCSGDLMPRWHWLHLLSQLSVTK